MPADQTSNSPFPTTHWTVVHTIQSGGQSEAAQALETLCARYWYPIYAFLRRSGHSQPDAEDLTQELFARLVSEEAILAVRRDQGKLRSYLLGVLKRVVADHLRRVSAEKRGGGKTHVSFDQMAAEERYSLEPQETRDPEHLFTAVWAQDLFRRVREKLRAGFLSTGRAEAFEALLPFVTCDEAPPSQRELAQRLGISTTAAGVMIFRLREKFRSLLRDEVAQTVLSPEEIPSEMTWLMSVLSGK